MNLELTAAVGGFDGVRPELEHGVSECRLLIAGEKAVAIKLDEDPIRTAAHADARVPPPLQSRRARRVRGGQRAVVELRPGKASREPAPIEDRSEERRVGKEWKQRRRAAL